MTAASRPKLLEPMGNIKGIKTAAHWTVGVFLKQLLKYKLASHILKWVQNKSNS